MELGIKDKVALVTASSTGLGFACAQTLLQEGAKVAIGSRQQQKVTTAVEQLAEWGAQEAILGAAVDYTQTEAMTHYLAEVQEKLGSIDILVCSSGGPAMGSVTEFDTQAYSHALEDNLLAMIRLSLALLPNMQANKWGRIIFITSSAAVQPIPSLALSNVARAGLHSFAKTLAQDVAKEGITVNCVMPGKINTDRMMAVTRKRAADNQRSLNEQMAMDFAKIPAGRYGQPQELANLVTFLCSEKASYINGSAIAVDGGAIMGLR